MSQFRKRPLTIEAVQFESDNLEFTERAPAWLREAREKNTYAVGAVWVSGTGDVCVMSKEGQVCGPQGMWIMRGVRGEIYLCDPDIFAETYEAV